MPYKTPPKKKAASKPVVIPSKPKGARTPKRKPSVPAKKTGGAGRKPSVPARNTGGAGRKPYPPAVRGAVNIPGFDFGRSTI